MDRINPSCDGGFIALTLAQRDVLLQELDYTLGGADDLKCLIRRRDATDLRWRRKLAASIWLLDDLGALVEEPRDVYYVTLPRVEFDWYLMVVRDGTLGCLRDNCYDDPELVDQELDVIATCDQLLAS